MAFAATDGYCSETARTGGDQTAWNSSQLLMVELSTIVTVTTTNLRQQQILN